MLKSKKVILGGTLLIAGAIVMSGTFAWFTDSDSVVNKMKLARFDVKLTEDWTEEEWQNLEPSAVVDKTVKVSNNGTADALVRVKLDEKIKLFVNEDNDVSEPDIFWAESKIEDTDTTNVAIPGYNFPEGAQTTTAGDVTYYKAITSLKDGETQCFVAKIDNYDGLARYNPTTGKVEYAYYKYADTEIIDNDNYFTPAINETDWEKIGDYYYYKKVLKAGEIANPLFETVNVSEDLPNTYIGSIYKLTPNMEAIQANANAVASVWTNLDDAVKTKVKGYLPTSTETESEVTE